MVSENWENINGERQLVHKPFSKLDNANFLQWDAVHYHAIKSYGYSIEKAGSDFIFAFFPLFPFIWSITNLPPIGILFLNYLMFSLSILLLLKLFSNKDEKKSHVLMALMLPSIVIFFIPYSEAIFFLMTTIAIYGFIRKKYWIYFAGLFLAALTRPTFTFLIFSIIGAEIFFLPNHKKILVSIKNIIIRTLPLIIGTFTVSIIQCIQGSGGLFKFIDVQKYWGNKLAIPHNLRDWSHEGFSINIGIVILIFFPLLWMLVYVLFKKIREWLNTNDGADEKMISPQYYFVILSVLYLIGSTMFIILFRGGSLHCLFRFTLCTPFAYILLFGAYQFIKSISIAYRFLLFAILSSVSIFILGLADYSTYWNFSDFGIFILISTLLFWLFQDYSRNKYYKVAQCIVLIFNIIWTTYLFNTYIANGWIFA